MPRMPDRVTVRTSYGSLADWWVESVGKCQCGADVFWCYTGEVCATTDRAQVCKVNAESDEDDIHAYHPATCPLADHVRQPEPSRRPSPRDLAAGEDRE